MKQTRHVNMENVNSESSHAIKRQSIDYRAGHVDFCLEKIDVDV